MGKLPRSLSTTGRFASASAALSTLNTFTEVESAATTVSAASSALGARPAWVLREVLLQTVLLVGLGGAAGFVGAWGLTALIGMTPLTENVGVPRISPSIGLSRVGFLLLVAVLAGLVPARHAARIDPVRALAD